MKRQTPDHNIWLNNGTYFCHFTVHGNDYTKHRVRKSLKTRDIHVARMQRDQIMAATPGALGGRGPIGSAQGA